MKFLVTDPCKYAHLYALDLNSLISKSVDQSQQKSMNLTKIITVSVPILKHLTDKPTTIYHNGAEL